MSDGTTRLHDLADTLIKGLVDDEESVHVNVKTDKYHTNIEVKVAPTDYGKVVGKGGHTAKALRTIITAVGNKLRLPICMLFVEDPNPDMRGRRRAERERW